MPNTEGAKKRMRQALVRRDKNRATKSSLHTQYKKVLAAVQEGNAESADAELRLAAKKFDQAAAKGTIHRNAAARTKSRLSAKVKVLKGKA